METYSDLVATEVLSKDELDRLVEYMTMPPKGAKQVKPPRRVSTSLGRGLDRRLTEVRARCGPKADGTSWHKRDLIDLAVSLFLYAVGKHQGEIIDPKEVIEWAQSMISNN